MPEDRRFVSRAGEKLAFALEHFGVDPAGLVCADLGCHAGGFTDCLLQSSAERVYAVDTSKHILDWSLRNDARVVLMEQTNALHVHLPEPVDLVTVDVGWTRQDLIVPVAVGLLRATASPPRVHLRSGEEEDGERRPASPPRVHLRSGEEEDGERRPHPLDPPLLRFAQDEGEERHTAWLTPRRPLPTGGEEQVDATPPLVITLIKPHYEATDKERIKGKVRDDLVEEIVRRTLDRLRQMGFEVSEPVESPILGSKGKNREFLATIRRSGV